MARNLKREAAIGILQHCSRTTALLNTLQRANPHDNSHKHSTDARGGDSKPSPLFDSAALSAP
jgi:hypothetical protein